MALVNIQHKNRFFSFYFGRNVQFGPIRWSFSKFRLFIVENRIFITLFRVLYKNYSMRRLSICGNDFIACLASEETNTESMPNKFSRMLSQRVTNFCACSANEQPFFAHDQHTGKSQPILKRDIQNMLSIRGTNLIAG
jgi:hypothetical protein